VPGADEECFGPSCKLCTASLCDGACTTTPSGSADGCRGWCQLGRCCSIRLKTAAGSRTQVGWAAPPRFPGQPATAGSPTSTCACQLHGRKQTGTKSHSTLIDKVQPRRSQNSMPLRGPTVGEGLTSTTARHRCGSLSPSCTEGGKGRGGMGEICRQQGIAECLVQSA